MAISLISHAEVTTLPTNTITFSSIPGTFSDLLIIASFRTQASGGGSFDQIFMKLNNTSSSLLSYTLLTSNNPNTIDSGQSRTQTEHNFGRSPVATSGVGRFSTARIFIPNYAGSNFKQYRTEQSVMYDGTNYHSSLHSGFWRNTSAISRIDFRNDNATSFSMGTTVTLYGITKA